MFLFPFFYNKRLEKSTEFLKEDCERYICFVDSSFPDSFRETEISLWVIRQGEYLKGKIDLLHSLSALSLDDADGFKYMIDKCIESIHAKKV